jgi:hypothetical protein
MCPKGSMPARSSLHEPTEVGEVDVPEEERALD